jgi:hypothetical protein
MCIRNLQLREIVLDEWKSPLNVFLHNRIKYTTSDVRIIKRVN